MFLQILGSLILLGGSALEVSLAFYAVFKVQDWASEGTDFRFALAIGITFVLAATAIATIAVNIYLAILIWTPRVAEAL